MRITRRIITALLIAAFLTTCLIPAALADVSARVSSSSARVYQYANTRAASIKVPKNLNVSISAIANGWARVHYKGYTAYMPLGWLTPSNKVPGYVSSSTNVYSWNLKKMGTVSAGTGVYALGTIGNYYLVMSGSGTLGYIPTGKLSATKPSGSKSGSGSSGGKTSSSSANWSSGNSKMDKALSVAKGLLGRPYSVNSNPPSSFDCSSFVWYCLSKAGYSIGKTSWDQANDGRYAKISSISALKTGDILCFDTSGDGNVDHTALYIGGDKFVEASRNAGEVQVNTLTDWYWEHFKWARRPS